MPQPDDSEDKPVRARTMAEIAALAGVAESTVSRALAGSERVSEETRERIRKLVQESGYRINSRARSLRTRRSRTIEVVIGISETNRQHFSDPFFSQIVAAIADALAENDYDLLLSRARPWDDVEGADAIASNRADGVIIIGQGREPEKLAEYAASRRNVVVWGADIPDRSYPVVGSDNLLGGRLVARRLLAQGRRRLVFLGDIRHVEIGLRHRGCMEEMTSAGAAPDQTLTLSMPFDSESAYGATRELFRGGIWHDAVFAASDVLAVAAMQALSDLGVRVPEDVSVIGYDDIALAAYVSPALTTIRQDTVAGGRALVENLLTLLDGGEARDAILPTELIVRRSCGGS
ncbi:LacI family DNA-binding transcriptional regulator [Amphiplicatus metriothermophilus]|uniref:Transcriptional regulator, LacI family n=1 Tax=Amphiplicatus metriothermophilus TaxID=1519374 RepID=A0A239PQI9_9PROT|nr:LacI family DNA-binding transcriptional regulator [Amphiplicatus metriothermophilus]MBB5518438.1 DNA-binding LacI/PurR family transcriptional regulator [Amphiplicatus metriothermophilus]SNT72400.1 transcriptional regulator, LacI family [Amphiplicatus metriothermophilus]